MKHTPRKLRLLWEELKVELWFFRMNPELPLAFVLLIVITLLVFYF